MRRFIRIYLLKIILAAIVVELLVLGYKEYRNQPPEPIDDKFESYAGKTLEIKVLKNDTDKEGDSLHLVECEQRDYAQFNIKGNRIEVIVGTSFVGKDSVKYYVSDGNSKSKAYIKFNIIENLPPAGNTELLNLYQWNKKYSFNPLANVHDREEDSVFIQSYSQPLHGQISFDSVFTYIPNNDFFGEDSIMYIASDGFTSSEKIWVIINRKNIPIIIGKWADIQIVNPGFELPDDGIKYQLLSKIPGWRDDKEVFDGAGREASNLPNVEGKMNGFFAAHIGGSVYQPVSDVIFTGSTTYKLSFLACFSGGYGNPKDIDFMASIGAFEVDGDPARRKIIETRHIKIPTSKDGFKQYEVIFKIPTNSPYANKQLTIEFDTEWLQYIWVGIDDVKLSKLVQ